MPGYLRVFVLAQAVAAACSASDYDGFSPEKNIKVDNSSEILAKSLRRQLKMDNYDYMSTENEESQPHDLLKQNRTNETVMKEKDTITIKEKKESIPKKTKDQSSSQFIKQSSDDDLKRKGRGKLFRKLAKRKKKVLKYMYRINEDMAKRYRHRHKVSHKDNSATDHIIIESTTVKYKVLKLESPYRRNGHAAALIQEESPQGVSIVKLGIGSFPEFRLPHPRRQYMDVPQPLGTIEGDEEELPPPPIDDITKANEDRHTKINDETINTEHLAQTYFNKGNESLTITVTPDEILVL